MSTTASQHPQSFCATRINSGVIHSNDAGEDDIALASTNSSTFGVQENLSWIYPDVGSLPAEWGNGLLTALETSGIRGRIVAHYVPDFSGNGGCDSPSFAFLHDSDPDPLDDRIMDQLRRACEQSARDGQPRRRRELSQNCGLYIIPVHPGTVPSPVVGLVCDLRPNDDNFYDVAQSIVSQWGQRCLIDQIERERSIADSASAINELIRLALAASNFDSAAQIIVSELARFFGNVRVLLGRSRSLGSRCELVAASDVAKLDRDGENTEAFENAFDEVVLLDHLACVHPAQSTGQSPIEQLSSQLRQSIVGLPIESLGEQGSLAIFVCGADSVSLDHVRRFLETLAPSIASIANVFEQRSRWASIRQWSDRLRKQRLLVTMAAGIILTLAMFIPINHRESCEAIVEPSLRRFVAIPFDATLLKCEVNPGDEVRQGQILAILEDRPLRWRLESLQADFEKAQKTKATAQATHDYAKQRIAELDMQKAAIEIELLQHQLKELEVRSPIDGVIVSGDHQRSQGVPVKTGETLFEVAPLEQMTLEFSISESQVRHIQDHQIARIALEALPNERWQSEVQRISPRSEIRDGQNVFIGEVPLPGRHLAIRPGMRGTVSIHCGQRSIGWILFHRPYESLTHHWW
ncbi:efflux RND transporter periplasmic adaptor subunit [Roseiconus lacunae]|uniref:efflux RND transporter periplasmic adaptor subunit n=1 Tax=Roseiconus lacunae TaxID=2605694 RepID=UPI00308841F9|nr:efflux RND transporter periplasmic adaptor subunit [Stieleria sp. HD01]